MQYTVVFIMTSRYFCKITEEMMQKLLRKY